VKEKRRGEAFWSLRAHLERRGRKLVCGHTIEEGRTYLWRGRTCVDTKQGEVRTCERQGRTKPRQEGCTCVRGTQAKVRG
jgi:hypothetical protein